jgi:hypothetical protein
VQWTCVYLCCNQLPKRSRIAATRVYLSASAFSANCCVRAGTKKGKLIPLQCANHATPSPFPSPSHWAFRRSPSKNPHCRVRSLHVWQPSTCLLRLAVLHYASPEAICQPLFATNGIGHPLYESRHNSLSAGLLYFGSTSKPGKIPECLLY